MREAAAPSTALELGAARRLSGDLEVVVNTAAEERLLGLQRTKDAYAHHSRVSSLSFAAAELERFTD
jgi:hypothetical protein